MSTNRLHNPQIHDNMHHDWRMETPKRVFRRPWNLAYRYNVENIASVDHGTVNGTIIPIDSHDWALQNGGLGFLKSCKGVNGSGLEFAFNNIPSTPDLSTGINFPYVWINPAVFSDKLESDLGAGEMSGEDNIKIVIAFDEDGDQNGEFALAAFVTDAGPTHTGSGFAAECGFVGGKAQVGWIRQQGGIITEQNQAGSADALQLNCKGPRSKVLWARRSGAWGPHALEKDDWSHHIDSGMGANITPAAVPFCNDGRRLLVGGYSNNFNANLIVIFKSIEVWYQRKFSNYDTV